MFSVEYQSTTMKTEFGSVHDDCKMSFCNFISNVVYRMRNKEYIVMVSLFQNTSILQKKKLRPFNLKDTP